MRTTELPRSTLMRLKADLLTNVIMLSRPFPRALPGPGLGGFRPGGANQLRRPPCRAILATHALQENVTHLPRNYLRARIDPRFVPGVKPVHHPEQAHDGCARRDATGCSGILPQSLQLF